MDFIKNRGPRPDPWGTLEAILTTVKKLYFAALVGLDTLELVAVTHLK